MIKCIVKINEIIKQLALQNSILIPDFLGSSDITEMFDDLDFINDLNFDSIILMTMVIEIEKAFNIELPEEALSYDNLRSYKTLCEIISNLL
jgi:acyl carrier protein